MFSMDLKPDRRLSLIGQRLWELEVKSRPGFYDKSDRWHLRLYAKIYGRLAKKIQAFQAKLARMN